MAMVRTEEEMLKAGMVAAVSMGMLEDCRAREKLPFLGDGILVG
jgi:hypothetical protein